MSAIYNMYDDPARVQRELKLREEIADEQRWVVIGLLVLATVTGWLVGRRERRR